MNSPDSVERVVEDMRRADLGDPAFDGQIVCVNSTTVRAWADRLQALARGPQQAGGEDGRNMPDGTTFEQYRDALAVGGLAPLDQMGFDNLLDDELERLQAEVARLLIRIETLRSTADRATVRADDAEAALREESARLDWLERVGFTTRNREGTKDVMNVHSWVNDSGGWTWTAQYIGSEFPTARAAIDAALNGGQDDA